MSKGFENGVEWEVDDSKFDPVFIKAKNVKSGKGENYIYNCQHKPIFGYDVFDANEIERILDELIKKYSD